MADKDRAEIPDEEIPRFVRRCHDRYMDATSDRRKAYIESLGFYVGGRSQWRPGEVEAREGSNRPWCSINRCRPAVDQVTNEARNNPPGPEADPVGGGADKDGADILEGLIREYEYRCKATDTRVNALTYGCAGGFGVWEMGTDFVDQLTMEQQIVLKYVDDPATLFYDPNARLPGFPDSMWGGRIYKFDREALIEHYGADLKVLNTSYVDDLRGGVGGWMQDLFGWANDWASANTWTGAAKKGPYYVCEFFMVKIKHKVSRLYSDHIWRYDGDPVPENSAPREGDEFKRDVQMREVWKYVVTAFDVISKTLWYGTIVPHFWVTGPIIWIDGKFYCLSLIEGAKDPQRLLNYTATSIAEILGSMTRSPWFGYEGAFDVTNAQGERPWDRSNTQAYQYMEVKATFATDDNGVQHLLPPPWKNNWEAPIARAVEAVNMFTEMIKAATSVFFEPSVASAKAAQSGEAIKALQAQTNIGTGGWQAALQSVVQLEYWQASIILPKIYDGPRVRAIVRPDTTHEIAKINQDFPAEEMEGNKHRTPDGKLEPINSIMYGQYALRVKAGPDTATRTKESLNSILDTVKVAPQILQSPASQASLLRMIGGGNPEVESFADGVAPATGDQANPEQMAAQLQRLTAQSQQKDQIIQLLTQKLQTQQPKIDADLKRTAADNLTKIRVAEINASKDADSDRANILADQLATVLGLAHETALQATEHEHASDLADQQSVNQMQQNQQNADLAPEPESEQ